MAHSHQASAHSHHGQGGSNLRTSAQATLHCLTGCVIGEVAGLLIGVSVGLAPWQTILLATALAYLAGMTLGLVPVMRSRGIGLLHMGGMSAPSVASWMFWRGIVLAVPAGFLAAWPVNYWLLKREMKACH